MNNFIDIKWKKQIPYKGQNIFELICTKTNRYYLIETSSHRIVATVKNRILYVIKYVGLFGYKENENYFTDEAMIRYKNKKEEMK